MEASGVILAGGRSSRMGRDKTLMLYKKETLIERTVNELRQAVDEVMVITNRIPKYNLPGVVEEPDIYPEMGPLAGIHAGLLYAKYQYTFVISCDMPLFKAELAVSLLNRSPGYDVVVPKLKDGWEPLCAVYSKNCIGSIEKCLQSGVKKVIEFFPQVRVLEVGPEAINSVGKPEDLFYNLNIPEDYSALCRFSETRNTHGMTWDNHHNNLYPHRPLITEYWRLHGEHENRAQQIRPAVRR